MLSMEESQQHPGYWKHRWTDQPVYVVMLGMWYNLTEREARSHDPHPAICNLASWRGQGVFVHY